MPLVFSLIGRSENRFIEVKWENWKPGQLMMPGLRRNIGTPRKVKALRLAWRRRNQIPTILGLSLLLQHLSRLIW